MEKDKKRWLSHRSVVILHQVITTKKVIDLLNIAENKSPKTCDQIIVF